jgi:carbamoyl-phosphate synthase large subunit
MTTRIMITGTGGAAAVGLLNAWRSVDAELFAADMDPYASGLFLVEPNRRLIIPRGDAVNFADHMVALCAQLRIDMLVPTVDAELIPLAHAEPRFRSVGTTLMAAPLPALVSCLDKWVLVNAASGVVPVPKSSLLTPRFRQHHAKGKLIVKPRRGSGGRGIEVLGCANDLGRLGPSDELLVQEFLPGEEYSVDVLRLGKDHPVACVPRLRIKVDSGVAVASRTVHDAELIDLARRITEHFDIRGIANVQFRRASDGTPRLLEINPRVPGTLSLTVASGIDMPNLWLAHTRGETIVIPTEFEEIAMVRTWQEHFMPVESMIRPEAQVLARSA